MNHRLNVVAGFVNAGVNFYFRALGDPGRSVDQEALGVADDHVRGTHDGQPV